MAKNVPAPLRLAIWAKIAILGKIARELAIIEKRLGPLETGDLGENSHFGENRQMAGDNRKTSRPLGDWRFRRK